MSAIRYLLISISHYTILVLYNLSQSRYCFGISFFADKFCRRYTYSYTSYKQEMAKYAYIYIYGADWCEYSSSIYNDLTGLRLNNGFHIFEEFPDECWQIDYHFQKWWNRKVFYLSSFCYRMMSTTNYVVFTKNQQKSHSTMESCNVRR